MKAKLRVDCIPPCKAVPVAATSVEHSLLLRLICDRNDGIGCHSILDIVSGCLQVLQVHSVEATYSTQKLLTGVQK